MESEKVKEIKKALETYGNENKGITILRSGEIQAISYIDILTLINELEESNEKLYNLGQNTNTALLGLHRDNERLSDIIQQREGEIKAYKEVLEQYFKPSKNYILCDGTNLDYTEEDDISEKLCEKCRHDARVEFAERLKEKLPVHYPSVIDSIDETLKDFL